MSPDKNTLSIRLTEPVVPLRNTSEHPSRRYDGNGEVAPPAVVRGLFTLTLVKPTKVSSIELELQAKATTRYAQGAGPSRTDVTEQYKVHSASTVMFKAGPMPQVRQRASSTRPRVQFLDDPVESGAQQGTRFNGLGSGHWQVPSAVTRSASLGHRSLRTRRQPGFDDLENNDDGNAQRIQISLDSAPPYSSLVGSFPNDDSYVESRSQSVASGPRATELQSSPILTSDIPHGSPTTSVHSTRNFPLSRTSSIEEVLEDDESFDTSVAHPDNVAYYGLSRIATGSSGRSPERDHRGRSHSRFSFGQVVHIFDAVKDRVRSRSPRTGSLLRSDEREERGRSLIKGNGVTRVSTRGVGHALPQIGTAEPAAADGGNDQSGDGWVVFPEGTYTYPIFFMIPNNSPPTMKADHGSLIWKVKAEVKRPSMLKSNMTAQQEIIVVRLPKVDDSEEAEGLDLQRQWDDQFQYRVQIAGRGFPIGGKVPFQLTINPLAKIKVHCILVYLDERTAYYTRAEAQARSDALRRATLLVIKHNSPDARYSKPILPLLPNELDTFRKSPLYRFLRPGENESKVASTLIGPGPWTICHQLRVPDSCSILHPSNRTKGSNVIVDHTLKIILRVEREDETVTAGRKKLYDIVIHTPIQILSCHCTPEWRSLPRYDEALRGNSPEDTSTCPCRARRQAKAGTHTPLSPPLHRVTSLPTTSSNLSGGLGAFTSGPLADHTRLHELLMSGLVSERGESPPSYEVVDA